MMKKEFRFIDLFAGIGGLRIAFEKSGGRCVFSSEWNKFSQQTYEANFGEVPDGDITEIDAKDIPNHDILIGGFPCQPFSLAGVSKKPSTFSFVTLTETFPDLKGDKFVLLSF